MDTLDEFIRNAATLPTPPAIALKILEAAQKDKASMSEFAGIISNDPALSIKILSVANSSLYRLSSKVESIERAVSILGLEAVKNIALSFVLVKGFKRDTIDGFDHDLFWRRAITAATSSEILSAVLNIKRDDKFVTPLLMDVGVLVMYLCRPDDYLKVLLKKKTSRVTSCEAELEVFGFDHQAVGSEVLKKWSIPEDIYLPVAHHHNINNTPSEIQDFVDVLMISDMVSSVYHGSRGTEAYTELKGLLPAKFNLEAAHADEFIDSVAEKTVEILHLFEIDPGDIKPYSEILQEANEELGRLNLTYEQLLLELRQEKRKVEDLANELKIANEKLRGLVFQDELTGLNNKRYFEDYLVREMNRSERYSHSLSVIIADIDEFRMVNDRFSYGDGDSVICKISGQLRKAIRNTDFMARYGGEEFVFILPETDIHRATFFAERIRKLVESMDITVNREPVKLTVSIGVTIYNPHEGQREKEEIIDSAHRALCNAKKSGKNRLSIVI